MNREQFKGYAVSCLMAEHGEKPVTIESVIQAIVDAHFLFKDDERMLEEEK